MTCAIHRITLNSYFLLMTQTFFLSGYDIDELYSTMNSKLTKITNWCSSNILSLKVKKTVYMLFHKPKKKKIHLDNHHIRIGDSFLSRVDNCKFLGIIIDQHLTFKPHIQYIASKNSKNNGIISHICRFITSSIAVMLCRNSCTIPSYFHI